MATEQELSELQELAARHPEVRDAWHAFEASLEKQAQAAAVVPPPLVKEALLTRLQTEFTPQQAPVVPMRGAVRRYFTAAAVLLLVASAALNVYFYNRFRSANTAYLALLTEKEGLIVSNGAAQTRMLNMYENMQLMSDPAVAKVTMPSAPGTQGNLATVFWDTRSKDVYLLTNQLPAAPEGKQYQLWAIINGKPVDAGMLDACAGLCRMKNIQTAQAFAITLEKKGGSTVPEGQMYVVGKVG